MSGLDIDIQLNNIFKSISPLKRADARMKVTKQAKDDMEQYVPKDTGALRSSAVVVDDETIVYSMSLPYGRKQYYTQFTNYTTPGTGPFWDKKASSNNMSKWEKIYVRGLGL